MPNSKQIVYLSQAQYAELIASGSITVDGVTVTYNENDIYVTPQAEPVTDVKVAGTSVAANGVANIPMANDATIGVVKTSQTYGTGIYDGKLQIQAAPPSHYKSGEGNWRPITPGYQHQATFYGLAKASGDTTQSQSSNAVGSYTPEAKGAIQQMLGMSNLLAPIENGLTASQAYSVGDMFTSNGKLYKVTAAIAANESLVLQNEGETVSGANAVETKIGEGFVKFTDYATSTTPGVVRPAHGLQIYQDQLSIKESNSSQVKAGWLANYPITISKQHEATFYGLAKAAGDTTQAASDNAVGTYTDNAKSAIRTMLGTVGATDYASSTDAGVIKVASNGITLNSSGVLTPQIAIESDIKTGTTTTKLQVPANQHISTFYGLAKASGDTTQSASSNAVGVYTDNAKASIKAMLGIVDGSTGTVDVSGTTPTITAVENTRYVCGEVTSLNFTPAAAGICIVRFTSGSTPTILTIPSIVKFPEWFNYTELEADTIYEICVTDGIYGAVMSWAL